MPMFYHDIVHLLSLRSKLQRDGCSRLGKALVSSSCRMQHIQFNSLEDYLRTNKEGADSYKSFQSIVADTHSSLLHSLFQQNRIRQENYMPWMVDRPDHLMSYFSEDHDYYRLVDLFFMSGIVQSSYDYAKVLHSGVLDNYSIDKLRDHFDHAAILPTELRSQSSSYSGEIKELKNNCLQCTGGPCIFGGDSGVDDINICLEAPDNCPWESAYKKFVKNIYSCIKKNKKTDFIDYLHWKGIAQRRIHQAESFGSESYFTVPEAAEVKMMGKIQKSISELSYGAKSWIKEELIKLNQKPKGIRTPAPISHIYAAFICGGFLTFVGFSR